MAKDLTITMLFDFYGELLTEKQKLAMDLYYNQDLSLAEIAEPLGISRQGVRDFIKRGEKQLLELEQKMGLLMRFRQLHEQIGAVRADVAALREFERTHIRSYQLADKLNQLDQKLRQMSLNL